MNPCVTLTDNSPFNSLTPHIPTQEFLPGVSDSSEDEEEQEFMQGLVFESLRSEPSRHQFSAAPSDLSPSQFDDDSLGYDEMDSTKRGNNGQQWSMDVSPSTAVQTLASTLLQYPSAGSEMASALLSSLGQSVLSTVVSNTLAANAAAAAARNNIPEAVLTDATDSNTDEYSDPPPFGEHTPSHQPSTVRARRTRPVRRVVKRTFSHHADETTTESDETDRNDEDFEIISDDEISDS